MGDDERAPLDQEARASGFDPDSFAGKEGLLELDRLCRQFATDGTPSSLSNLKFALRSKAGGTYEKHEVPYIASAALISRGPEGLQDLLTLLREIRGHIYPYAIIDTIWRVATNRPAPRSMVGIPAHSFDERTRNAAKAALDDIILDGDSDPRIFELILSLAHNDNNFKDTYDDGTSFAHYFVQVVRESSITLTVRSIREFATLLRTPANEKVYQQFLEENPVFLDPLAAEILPQHRLGNEFITDYVLRRHDGRYIAVEIENAKDRIFTRSRDFTAKFNHAIGQVLDFQGWISENVAYAQKKLPSVENPGGLLVIGMRSNLSESERAKLRRWQNNSRSIEVATFDDLLERAKALYVSLRRIHDISVLD